MDMKDNRNLTIGILLSLGSVLLTCTLYLGYHFMMAEGINHFMMAEGINRDLNMEYALLARENKELQQKLEEKEKAGSRVPT